MFSIGYGFGLLMGLLAALGIPCTQVRPNVWKAEMMEGMPRDKMASVVASNRLFPGSIEIMRKPKGLPDHNIADALLIAEWGRRSLMQKDT